MGRHYRGDIEGKMWFGIQSSNDAEFFGGFEIQPPEVEYYFDKDNLLEVSERLEECKKELGIYKDKLDKYFNDNDGYTHEDISIVFNIDEDISRVLNIDMKKVYNLLVWYARFELGEKIKSKLEETGVCEFIVDL